MFQSDGLFQFDYEWAPVDNYEFKSTKIRLPFFLTLWPLQLIELDGLFMDFYDFLNHLSGINSFLNLNVYLRPPFKN